MQGREVLSGARGGGLRGTARGHGVTKKGMCD